MQAVRKGYFESNQTVMAPLKQGSYYSTKILEKCTFKWTMEYFCRSALQVGSSETSPIFPRGEEDMCKWALMFYPNGESEQKKEYFCLKLSMEEGPNIEAEFELRLTDSNDREWCYRRDDRKFKKGEIYSWEQLPKKEYLKRVIKDDIIVIDFSITCTVQNVDEYSEFESPVPYLRMVDNYAELKKSGKLCDAIITIGTNTIPVHSVVMAARSPVFMAMFEHSTKEKELKVVQIEDIELETMQHLLEFIYSCNFPAFDVSTATNLLKAADKYDLPDLKDQCLNFLAMSLNTSNVVDILLVADMYSIKKLKNAAMACLRLNKARVSSILDSNDASKLDKTILIDILQECE